LARLTWFLRKILVRSCLLEAIDWRAEWLALAAQTAFARRPPRHAAAALQARRRGCPRTSSSSDSRARKPRWRSRGQPLGAPAARLPQAGPMRSERAHVYPARVTSWRDRRSERGEIARATI